MATQNDVKRIALSLPESAQDGESFAFCVHNKGKCKGFVWVWLERVEPKKARVPNSKVLAVRVANLDEKEMLLASDGDKFFTEDHYNRFPAVLVRLAAIGKKELGELIIDAWRTQAPKTLVAAYDAGET